MNFLGTITKRIGGFFKSLQSQLIAKLSKVKRLPNTIAKGFKDVIRNMFKTLVKKPESLEDYKKLGNFYVSKRALFFLSVLMLAVIVVIYWFGVPYIKNLINGRRVIINTAEYHQADGSVSVFSENDLLIYEGTMKEGRITGNGKLYNEEILIYDGDFIDEKYNGQGYLYGDGGLMYEGDFTDNLYNGNGRCYEAGVLVYDGSFNAGIYEGEGKLYGNGDMIYEGDFVKGVYEGEGKLYKNSSLIYEGAFSNGVYEGEGSRYDKQKLIYRGAFSKGIYSGKGILYKDERSYDSEFVEGVPEGQCLISDGSVQIFNGLMNGGEINYYAYLPRTTGELSSVFPANTQSFDLYGRKLCVYDSLKLAFIEGADGKTDRFVFYGDQKLYGFSLSEDIEAIKNGMNSEYYTEYEYTCTQTEKSLAGYIGVKLDEITQLYCIKYNIGDIFIKGYSIAGGRKFLFFEVGSL